ncbi:phage tail tip lysozyme [Allokutzneria sp. A3M-2-11 16]|uniref:phage tail tip lysozyme n=1 Tax=Allokutzneria sp. A3M-2-11 16 TaxID=2962043 RepID=UPI0020B70EA1|nr:phage tail tip lysozyme [Allokutzneria sp. A3M-2-11 16]MCP3803492.1 phage tail tip lysozyme [Allokutzneria sp. A3M-2-11 16]
MPRNPREPVSAQAYTVGPHVVFDSGQYSPGSAAGDRLLAHELTHVVQQGTAPVRPSAVGGPQDSAERDASALADRAAAGVGVSREAARTRASHDGVMCVRRQHRESPQMTEPLSPREWQSVQAWQSAGQIGVDPLTEDSAHNVLLVADAIFCDRFMVRGNPHTEDPLLCIDRAVTQADPRVKEIAKHVAARGEIVNWARATSDQRMLRVMTRLVTKHGFTPHGAAGLVGNLSAESGLIPNQVEGTVIGAGTPMTAPDKSGKQRAFSAQEVMNRTGTRGPDKPGVGLAQWTSPSRREALFKHQNQGASILFDMDAQVDFLVAELQGSFSFVHKAIVRSASESASSDLVVKRFEAPGALLNASGRLKPDSDPGVQKVLAERRRLAQQALRVFQQSQKPKPSPGGAPSP